MVTHASTAHTGSGHGRAHGANDGEQDDTGPAPYPTLYVSTLDQDAARAQARLNAARFNDFRRAGGGWSWVMDERGCLVEISGRFLPLLGRRPSEFLGEPFEHLGSFEPLEGGELPFAQARRHSAPFRDQLVVMKNAEGHSVAFNLSGVPIIDNAGQTIGYQGVAISVSEEQVLRPAAGGSVETARKAFLSNVSHELRTPLNAILGFADTMRMQMFGTLDDRYRGYCSDIVDAGQHLLALIEDMLDASDLERNAVEIEHTSIKLADVVTEVRALLEGQAEKAKVSMDAVRVGPDLRVFCDRRRLKQILVNLLSNAVKFTPKGGKVGLAAETTGVAGQMVAITVWDTGPGIPPERQEAIFERFVRSSEDSFAGVTQGVGLGLHIARELARRMDGDITLVSKVGEGARFTLTVPSVQS